VAGGVATRLHEQRAAGARGPTTSRQEHNGTRVGRTATQVRAHLVQVLVHVSRDIYVPN